MASKTTKQLVPSTHTTVFCFFFFTLVPHSFYDQKIKAHQIKERLQIKIDQNK